MKPTNVIKQRTSNLQWHYREDIIVNGPFIELYIALLRNMYIKYYIA